MATKPPSFRENGETVAGLPDMVRHILERKELFLKFGYDLDRERDMLLDQAGPLRGKILEAGTGKGHFSLALARRHAAFTSFDISKEESDAARTYLKFYGLEKFADFRVENGEALSFPDSSFDMVFSVNLVHHLKAPRKALEELVRVLKIKGVLVISDFTEEGFKTMDKIHALEGNLHDRGEIHLPQAMDYLLRKGMKLKKTHSSYFQQTYIFRKSQ